MDYCLYNDWVMYFNQKQFNRMICPRTETKCDNLSCIDKCLFVSQQCEPVKSVCIDYSLNPNLFNNIWQQCPVCNGDGTDHHSILSSSIPICKVCNGKRIISTFTGKPPQ